MSHIESDPSVIEMFAQGLYEVPYAVHKGGESPDTTHRQDSPEETVFRNLATLKNPYDLIPEERRRKLFDSFAESDRIYKQGLDDAHDLPLG